MKALVTGSAGFIGSHLCQMLIDDGHQVMGFDKKNSNDVVTCTLPVVDDVDRVFHLAAQTDARSTDAMVDARDNIMSAIRIFQMYGPKVTFSSSSAVNYPVTPYGIAKLACEYYAKMFGCGIVRFCNVFGPGGRSFLDIYQKEDFVNARLPGNQVRTYAHVETACEKLLCCKPGEFHILGGQDYTVREIVETVYTGKKVNWIERSKFDVIDGRQVYAV